MLALRLERKEMIEGGYAEHATGRQPQLVRDRLEQRAREKSIELLSGVQHFNERVAGILVARHGAFQQFLAIVPRRDGLTSAHLSSSCRQESRSLIVSTAIGRAAGTALFLQAIPMRTYRHCSSPASTPSTQQRDCDHRRPLRQ